MLGDAGHAVTWREDGIAVNQRGEAALDKKLFKRLVESMGEMHEIVRGARAPSRDEGSVTP